MILLFLVIVGCLAILWLWYRHYYEPYFIMKRSISLSGPTPELYFGNSRALADRGWIECMKQWKEQYGPTFLYFVGIQPVIFTQDVDIIRAVFVNKAGHFMERHNSPNLFLDETLDGEKVVDSVNNAKVSDWRRMHRLLAPLFTSKKVMQMGSLLEVCCTRMMKKLSEQLEDNDTIDVYQVFGNLSLDGVFTTTLGRDLDCQSDEGRLLLDKLNTITSSGSRGSILAMISLFSHVRWMISLFRKMASNTVGGKSWKYIHKIAKMIVDERIKQSTKRPDIVQGMLDKMDEGMDKDQLTLSKDEVCANSRIFLFAGYETTKTTLSMACYCLATHNEIQKKALEIIDSYFADNPNASLYKAAIDVPYIEMIILETLRVYPPLNALYRHCIESYAVTDELLIPKGALVEVALDPINYNEDFWSNPKVFDPERMDPNIGFNNIEGFLSFGAGPRACIGKRLGLLEAKMGLISFLREYEVALADDTNIEICTGGVARYPKHGVKLKVIRR